MEESGKMPPTLKSICQRWSAVLGDLKGVEKRMAYIRKELPAVLINQPLFREILFAVTNGAPYPDIRQDSLFANEILLYLDSRRLFSMRLYLYAPGEYSPVHDHNSWGLLGAVGGKLGIVRYRREDNGKKAGYARLSPTHRLTLKPGIVEATYPLEKGIHKTGSADHRPALQLSVYGTPLRRLHLNYYDPRNQTVYAVYPPRLRKKRLASQVLNALEE